MSTWPAGAPSIKTGTKKFPLYPEREREKRRYKRTLFHFSLHLLLPQIKYKKA